jgi:hypothetical protein
MTTTESSHKAREDKFAREVVGKELTYRRDKQWRIFSWTSTFLLATIGGVVVLAGKGQFRFDLPLRALMAVALLIIAIYACRWIGQNIEYESWARSDAQNIDKQLGTELQIPEPGKRWWGGYRGALALLAIAAVLAVILAPCSGA